MTVNRIESLVAGAVDRWEVRHLARPAPRRRHIVMTARNLTVRYVLGVGCMMRSRIRGLA